MTTSPKGVAESDAGIGVRAQLVQDLKTDLLGPESQDEVLQQSPATRYLVGMLAPQGTVQDETEDEDLDAQEDGETQERGPSVATSLDRSSIGLSVVLDDDCTAIDVEVTWGDYAKEDVITEPTGPSSSLPESEVLAADVETSNDIDRDADPIATARASKRDKRWRRTHRSRSITVAVDNEGRGTPIPVGDGIQVQWMMRKLGRHRVMSVFLVNARSAPAGRRPPDELWIFQPTLRLTGAGAPFIARELDRESADADPDVASADLIYRNRREFATGHGVGAAWTISPDRSSQADAVWSEVIPTHRVPPVRARGGEGMATLDMVALGAATDPDIVGALISQLVALYEQWIAERSQEVATVPAPHRSVAEGHIEKAQLCARRMREGIELIRQDPIVFQAFLFMNRAMAMQLTASDRARRARRGQPPAAHVDCHWRPFQLGFILQCLTGLAGDGSPDREIADLLWFPTGGGKTEAYLGLTAFALALRRLRREGGNYDGSAGTAVLMRYTLRLLTIQQFQRALALMCACEVIRQGDTGRWGETQFAIGLWVGQTVTPGYYSDSKAALESLAKGDPVYEGSPYQVLNCPWCGTDIAIADYRCDNDCERTLIYCPSTTCEFGPGSASGLPVLVVDEEIYHHPPALLLATVDKFAQMPWNGRIQALFGRVCDHCPRHGYLSPGEQHSRQHEETGDWPRVVVRAVARPLAPPDLIIQDELHLISGPLGTLVGIYETTVDALCRRGTGLGAVRPKVVASTATIRGAREQVRGVFARRVEVFPPQGLDASDSFFAREDTTAPGRTYVGVYAPGKSIKTSLVRAYAALLSRAQAAFEADPGPNTDAYMTLVGYFNSLRELGGVRRLIDDDVPARLRVLEKRGFGPRRTVYETRELTSRAGAADIARTLKRLDLSFGPRVSGQYPIDILLASNMLSVGVDIDRLGLMVVSAQPKTSAEYIQATSRVGRRYPGLVIEVYNWIRPRDTSHYERFIHYHDTFYRHVEATSVTPFSARARDRALPAVLAGYVRLMEPTLAHEQDANRFTPSDTAVEQFVQAVCQRVEVVTSRPDVCDETEAQVRRLVDEWGTATSPPAERPLVYTGRGTKRQDDSKTILLQAMERPGSRGLWPAAGSLREVENEVDVVLLDEGGNP